MHPKSWRITESLKLEGTSGDGLVQPSCPRPEQLKQVAQDHGLGFDRLQGWSLGDLLQWLLTLAVKNVGVCFGMGVLFVWWGFINV